MKILARYISVIFIKSYLLAVLGLTAIFMVQRLLTELIDSEFSATQILFVNLLRIPEAWVQMTPPSVMIAMVFTLSGLARTNELTACYSIGIGLRQISTVLLSIAFIICCFTLILNDRIVPPLFKRQLTYYWKDMKGKQDFYLDVKQDKIWYRSQNLIYNLRHFDAKTKTIFGMVVYTFDDTFKLVQVIAAKSAIFTPKGWFLKNGTVTLFEGLDRFPVTSQFEEKDLRITETPTDFQEIEKEVGGLRLKELYGYITKVAATGVDTKSFEVKFHSRISLSFIPLVMGVLAIPFATRTRREGGLAKDLGVSFVFTFFYWLFYSVGLSLGTNGALPPWLAAWLPSLIFVAVAVMLILNRRKAA